MMPANDHGLVHLKSSGSVLETANRLQSIVLSRGLRVMARIDHAGDAAKVGLAMPPAELLIFGNPLSGTPLMIVSPTVAIDLPLKVLVWQDVDGQVWVSYNSLNYLQDRHRIPERVLGNIAGIVSICEEAADQASAHERI
jgi:uncharacterized protein (DUF302 family)